MTKPALPAGVQNLLDLHSLKVRLIQGPVSNYYWRMMRNHHKFNCVTDPRVLVDTDTTLQQWMRCVKELMEQEWPPP